MSQFGMQMPGARAKRSAAPDVYTALAAAATIFLAIACVVMFQMGAKVGPDGNAFGLQEPGNIKLKDMGNN